MIEPADIDDETKEIVLESTKLLFPNVTDVACFREVFESFNWDLEKSINALQILFANSQKSDTESSASRESVVNLNSGLGQSAVIRTTTTEPQIPNFSSVVKSEPKETSQKMSKAMRKEQLLLAYEEAIRLKNPIRRIEKYTAEGIKVMIIMRGCPGSGKSTFVNQLATSLCQQYCSDQIDSIAHHILGADDFWICPQNGKYIFNGEYLEYAHLWNRKMVQQAAIEGRSPLFIDNTHSRMWEMKAVATIAVEYGYIIEILEPPNKWIFNENELVRRNVHGVHKEPIRKMLARYEHGIKPTLIMSKYGLSYPLTMRPPQRCIVTFDHPPSKTSLKIFNNRFYSAPSLDVIFALKSDQELSGGYRKPPPKPTGATGGYSLNAVRLEIPNRSLQTSNILPHGSMQPSSPIHSFSSNVSKPHVAASETPLRPHIFQPRPKIPSSSSEGSLNSLQDETNVSSAASDSPTSTERSSSPVTLNEDSGQELLRTTLLDTDHVSLPQQDFDTNSEFVLVKKSGELLFHKTHSECPHTWSEFVNWRPPKKTISRDLEEFSQSKWETSNQNLNPEETWKEQSETPNSSLRSDSPKLQRSLSLRSQKTYEFWTNTNYEDFDLLKKVNSGQLVVNSQQMLIGRANMFKGVEYTFSHVGAVKMIATHDKSSMTPTEWVVTVDTNTGIEMLRQMFPKVPIDSLAELFEKCDNNLDDTVGLLIDSGMILSSDFIVDDSVQIEPTLDDDQLNATREKADCTNDDFVDVKNIIVKTKKNKSKLSGQYSDLIEKITNNIKLNEDHYSENLKKVRDTKSGKQKYCVPQPESETSNQTCLSDNEPSDSHEEEEEAMEISITNKLFLQLQKKFGAVPPNLINDELKVKLPVTLARQLYSYALDSICELLENQQEDIDRLIKDEEFARQLQGESDQSYPANSVSLQDIMDHEMALKALEKKRSNETTIASKLSQRLLVERFPKLDPATLAMILEDTNHSLEEATNLLKLAGHEPHTEQKKSIEDLEEEYQMTRDERILQANAYREVSEKLNNIKSYYFTKATEFHKSGNFAVATFYSEMFNWYSERIKESNSMAARAMLYGSEGATTVDLHFLQVGEALNLLDLFIDERIRLLNTRKQDIYIITGRGLHSARGVSKIKPAVKMRLKKRGLTFVEVNAGMLKTKITKTSVLSYAAR